MNQEKIGKFILKLRKEKNMTQQELAEKLGVTDRAVSNWENGRRLPDYSLLKNLCDTLSISINELFTGQKIAKGDYKKVADNNLLTALENSTFTLKDRIDFFKKKWKKEHAFGLTLKMIIIIGIIISGIFLDNGITYLGVGVGYIWSVIEYNRMMAYIEKNAYGNQKITTDEFLTSIERLKELKEKIVQLDKQDAINYLRKETGLSKKECLKAYNFAIKIDFNKKDYNS